MAAPVIGLAGRNGETRLRPLGTAARKNRLVRSCLIGVRKRAPWDRGRRFGWNVAVRHGNSCATNSYEMPWGKP